jgi:hypothetical protein
MPPANWSGFTDARKGRYVMAWKRYKDPISGDEFTADEVAGTAMGLKPLDKVAVDASDRPLPTKPSTDKAGAKSTQKDG